MTILPLGRSVMTVDEYLAFERQAERRHVYLDGRLFAMAGESEAHGIITVNLVGQLYAQLRGTPCQVRSKDTKVRSGPAAPRGSRLTKGMFSYPDLLVICGEPEHHDENKDVILNPAAVIEVLSPSTESFDRGEKLMRFRHWNPTLREYILIAQDHPQMDHYSRRDNGEWVHSLTTDLAAEVAIPSIHCLLKLADVYERVKFPEPEPVTDDEPLE